LRRVDEITLRFPGTDIDPLPLGGGVHGIGRAPGGALRAFGEAPGASARFCVDRRGVWLTVAEDARGVHVNGRPVRRMAMLRVGDTVFVDGVEIVLAATRHAPAPPPPGQFPDEDIDDPRVVLRGVGGRYHGRSFTLDRPRVIGSNAEADVRIDDPAFAERHARIGLQGGAIVLRDLGSEEGSVVNGELLRDALLLPGDQIVFDAHHRFVIEAPARAMRRDELLPMPDDGVDERVAEARQALGHSARRLPWLLLAALLIAAALSALLLFGVAG
jgi:pSer/pThr/pTyr-binding forkhead associated (FHA) protein